MEKLTERIGLFDLWVVFFPGAIGMVEVLFFTGALYSIYIKQTIIQVLSSIISDNVAIWIIWIFASFFIGTIFQELGRALCKITKYKNSIYSFLNPNAGIFSEKELTSLKDYLVSCGWDENQSDDSITVFHHINANAQKDGTATKYVKLNILQNVSFSLSSAMLLGVLLSILILMFCIFNGRSNLMLLMLLTGLLCIVLSVIFYRRAKRYNRYWVRNLVYAMAENQKSRK